MDYLTINLNSVVCPVCKGATLVELSHLRKIAKEKVVELHFFNEWCRIIGDKNRKVKVPAKAIKSGAGLVSWIEDRINKAWD